MGRTNPTYRDAIRRLEQRWGDYRRALRPADRERFDRLIDDAREHADAGGNLNASEPVVPVLLSMALARERRIDGLGDRVSDLEADREDLESELDRLGDDLGALREDLGVLRDEFGNTREDLGDAREDLGDAREDVDGLRREVETLGDRLDDLRERVEDLDERVDEPDGGDRGRSAAGIRSLFEFLEDEAV